MVRMWRAGCEEVMVRGEPPLLEPQLAEKPLLAMISAFQAGYSAPETGDPCPQNDQSKRLST